MALNPGKHIFIQTHAAKGQNYACQICRAPTARRARRRATLSRYS